MTIDNYIYFNKNITTDDLNNVISKINIETDYELILKNGPVMSEVIDNSMLDLNFEFKYKSNDYSKVIISLAYINATNLMDEMLENKNKEEINNLKNQLGCDKFSKQITISVVPKDDASYILFQLFTKELTQITKGIVLCYLYSKVLKDEEEIKYIAYSNVSMEINDNISSLFPDTIYINNNNCRNIPQANWNIIQKETTQTNKDEHATYNNRINFKYSIIYLIISIIFFIAIIICCPTEYLSDAPVWYQKLSDFSFIVLMLNVPVFILPFIISAIKRKSK